MALRCDLVGKYLEALQEGSWNPDDPRFNVAWKPEQVPAPPRQKLQALLSFEFDTYGNGSWSKELVAGFVRLMDLVITQAEALPAFAKLFSLDSVKWFKHEMAQLIIATARTFAFPQLPPHPLLAAKNWQRPPGTQILPSRLWLCIAGYLAPPVGRKWWESASLPFVMVGSKFGFTHSLILCKPLTAKNLGNPERRRLLKSNGLDTDYNWEQASDYSLRDILARASGQRVGLFNNLENLHICDVIQAVGLFWRVQSKIPVLLVGDLGTHSDIALCKITGLMLGSEIEVKNVATDGPWVDARSTDGCLSLLRFPEESLSVLADAVGVLQGDDSNHSPVAPLVSLHYKNASAFELQRHLPRQFRHAVVFL